MPDNALAAVENSVEEALLWCTGLRKGALIPGINVQFYKNSVKRPSRDVSSLPWLLVPAAFIQAVRQASGNKINSLPVVPELIQQGKS